MRQRSEEEFDLFVAALSVPLYRTALLMCAGDSASAADAVQTTMVEIWRRWPRVRAMERADAYAKRVLVTSVLRERRGRRADVVVVAEPPERPNPEPLDLPARHDLWAG